MKTKKNDQKNSETEPAKTQGKSIPGQQGTVAAGAPADKASLKKAEQSVDFEWSPGDVILNLYEVQKVTEGFGEDSEEKDYHEGGFGRVYKVWHRSWRRDMAVKTPRAEVFTTADQKEAFTRECETWINLGLHPHIAACHYVRELGGVPRVFSEYAEGGTLEDWIRYGRLYEGDARKALARILDVSIQFARGLHYAHERGVIHQDVKPLNALMWNDQTLKVTDFGLAGARQKAGVAGPGNSPGAGNGQSIMVSVGGMTPSHCSPEQAAGEKLTRRTDIWSWAVSVLQMFNGEVTWQSGSLAAMALESYLEGDGENEEIPSMPSGVADLLRRCFREDPDDRPHELKECTTELCKIYQAELGDPYPRPEPRAAGDTADALNNRALSLLDLGKPGEAETFFNRALELDKHHVAATYNQGLVKWRSGLIIDKNILVSLEEIKKGQPENPAVECALGWVRMESGSFTEAHAHFKRAIDLGDNSDARLGLERVQPLIKTVPGMCLRTFEGHKYEIYAVTFSPDGRFALSGSDGELKLWDIATGQCLRTFEGHPIVESIAFSPDGCYAISGNRDNSLKLWDVTTGKYLRTFNGHTDKVESVAFSPDGSCVLSGSLDNKLKLWEAATGKCLRTFNEHKSGVNTVAFSPDGRYILSGSIDTTLKLWDISKGISLRTFEGHEAIVLSGVFSLDGCHVLSGSEDRTVKLWDVATGICLRTLKGHNTRVISSTASSFLTFSPDGRFALSVSMGKFLKIWDVVTGKYLHTLEGHTKKVFSMAFSPNGRFVLSGSFDKTLKLWEVASIMEIHAPLFYSIVVTAEEIISREKYYEALIFKSREAIESGKIAEALDFLEKARGITGFDKNPECIKLIVQAGARSRVKSYCGSWLKHTFEGHRQDVNSVAISFNTRFAISGGGILARKNSVYDLKLWEVETGRCLHTFKEHELIVKSKIYSPDGRFVVSGSRDKIIRLYEVSTGECLFSSEEHMDKINSVIFSPDRRYVISGGGMILSRKNSDYNLRLWELDTGKCLCTFKGHSQQVNSVTFSPDNRFIVSGSDDKTIKLWDVSRGRCLFTFEEHKDKIKSVIFSPDCRFIISGSNDKIIKLWEISSGRCLRNFEGHNSYAESVVFSPDGCYALSGSDDKMLRLWDVSTGKCLNTFRGHSESVQSVGFSNDGRYAFSGSWDKTIKLWDVSTGKCLYTFEGHTHHVESVAFSPDGRFIASGSEDKTIKLWEISSGRCLRTLQGHTGIVLSVVFSPDGRYILSGSNDKTLKLWELDWEYEFPGWADWDDGAEPYLHNFLNLRNGKWGEDDFKVLINELSHRGYGWLRPGGVHHKLEQMTPQYITRSWFSKIFTRKRS